LQISYDVKVSFPAATWQQKATAAGFLLCFGFFVGLQSIDRLWWCWHGQSSLLFQQRIKVAFAAENLTLF
jgi:hypothetical protein